MDTESFTGMPVDDFDTARAWYEIFAGRPPDRAPEPGEAAWRLAGTSWIAVVADAERAGSALLTMLVDDLERHVGFLAMRGIAPESVETVPGVVRKATIRDPAGNTITIEQSLATG
ncbi:MAG TPA: VOC family protein [Solirubrobacteraceae bacterium]|nr:VOC family protein [Solirubrobacteraceae bacterium]